MRPRRVGPAGAAMTMFICLLVPYRALAAQKRERAAGGVHALQSSCRTSYLTYGSVAHACSSCDPPLAKLQQLHQSGSDAQQPRRITRGRRRRGGCYISSAAATIRHSEAQRTIIPSALRPARVAFTHPPKAAAIINSGRNTAQRSNSSEARPTYCGRRRDAFET